MTDFRALCAELLCSLEQYPVQPPRDRDLIDRARDALALPEATQEPTDEEWDALKDRLWGKYETIGYQGERFMYEGDFCTALDLARQELARWGRQ